MPAVRQKFHLSSCADSRDRLLEEACKRLRKRLDAFTVTDVKALKPSIGRLRSMYYEAQRRAESDAELGELMRNGLAQYENGGGENVIFPLLLIQTKDGIRGPIIDRLGLGGRAVTAVRK